MDITPDVTQTQTPHSVEAEEAVLGAALINPEIMRTLDLRPEEFYIRRNGLVWSVLLKLFQAGTLDILLVSEELKARGKLAEIGGTARLMALINSTPTSMHAEHYAEVVREKSRRRQVLDLANELAMAAYDGGKDLEEAVSTAVSGLVTASQRSTGAVHISQFVSQVYDEVVTASKDPKDIFGIPTGFSRYNWITGGNQPGEELIISGDPGIGKSLLAFQMCADMADHVPGAVYELEMSARAVVRRAVAGGSKVTTRAMRSGRIKSEDWPVMNAVIEDLSRKDVYLSDSSNWTTMGIRADLARLKDAWGVQWFLIDYFDLLTDAYGRDDTERTKWLSGQLHSICKDLHIHGTVVHAFNKSGVVAGANQKSKGSLAGSVKLAYDADIITLLTQPDPNINEYRLVFDKFRDGDGGGSFVELTKLPGLPRFEELAKGQEAKR